MNDFVRRMRTRPRLAPDINASYFEKLLKLIPGDIVAGYTALAGMIATEAATSPVLHWIIFGALLALTPAYTCYLKTDPPGILPSKVFPCLAATFAFTAWVFALGGPFAAQWPLWYKPVYGSVVLILVTLTLPVLEKIFYNIEPPSPQ